MKTIFVDRWNMVLLKYLLTKYGDNQPAERQYAVFLADELASSTVILTDHVPPDAVRLNSRVRLKDVAVNKDEIYKLVLPQDAGREGDHVSVLAPLGAALLGRRVGDNIEVKAASELRTLRVEQVWQSDREKPMKASITSTAWK